MTEISLTQQFEQLFEPAARAARRGDADQIRKVLESVRSIWKGFRKRRKADAGEQLAQGMTYAIEGILGIVLASAGADARYALLEGRKYALPVLHALGKKARDAAAESSASDASLRMGELAKAVGVLPQNIGELVDAMSDCGLVRVTDQAPSRRVTITDIGAQMLEAAKPGWQLKSVEQDLVLEQFEESFGRAMEQFEAMDRTRDPYCLTLANYLKGSLTGGVVVEKQFPTGVAIKDRRVRNWHAHFGTAPFHESAPSSKLFGSSDSGRIDELDRLSRIGVMTRRPNRGELP